MVLQKTMNAPSSNDWYTVRFLLGFRQQESQKAFVDERPWKMLKRNLTDEDLITSHEEIHLRMLSDMSIPLEMDFENVPNMVDWIRRQRTEIRTYNPYRDRDDWLYRCYLAARSREEFRAEYLGEFIYKSEESEHDEKVHWN